MKSLQTRAGRIPNFANNQTEIMRWMAVFLLLCSAVGRGQDNWLLTTTDFRSQRATLRALDADSIGISVSDREQKISMNHFLRIQKMDSRLQNTGRFVAVFAGGDQLPGQPQSTQGENLLWENALLGKVSLPLNSIRAIARSGEADVAPQGATATEDVVTLVNGDVMRGIIAGIDDANVRIQSATGDSTSVPLVSIRRVSFAAVGTPATNSVPRARAFRVGLADGSTMTVTSVQLTGDKMTLAMPDGTSRSVSSLAVNSIEQVDGPVVWLSSLTPTESVSRAFLELSWPARMDRAVDGEPIRFEDRIYSRGIGVHAYSLLSFPIDPSAQAFRTQYAISGDWPYANVTVRIKLDGQVVHEAGDVRSGKISQPVVISVTGHKTLSLEVDYGQNYDVQDRLNWIEPAFLKFDPKSISPDH
ncbi:MAG TPA: NPCBM/NEW2 domain-containing protein [Tepidisphaeraceae bacterium]|nr:NPCBM/NEW2 domain-containing protein [Tepidisphaeraceae bacterium]